MYRIERITDKEEIEKPEDKCLMRKGSTVKLFHLSVGSCMILEYIKDQDGNEKVGHLRTSIVQGYSSYDKTLKVTTMNSVYYLTEA